MFRRLAGRDGLPEGFAGALDPDERVLGVATLQGGDRHLVATSVGLWLPTDDGARRLGWHMVSKATWKSGAFVLVEAVEAEEIDGAVLLTDRPPVRWRIAQPGRLPEVVRARVEGSIRSRHHRDLPGGGAWFVQRKIAGRDGMVLQVRPDPGTDLDAVRSVAGAVARTLAGLGPTAD
ncbi:hypothetical protein KDL28_16680 [Pseudonocardia sp. S2-4]|uniref:Uncharacterized protein n=1 Tax=Pseudonocardia humida TaxID=2800819 RepID=A0ABT1A114_9PSEU|nr:hypothetical protein [Pseudonocardia humida]